MRPSDVIIAFLIIVIIISIFIIYNNLAPYIPEFFKQFMGVGALMTLLFLMIYFYYKNA